MIESKGLMRLNWFENEIVNGATVSKEHGTVSKEHGTVIAIIDYQDDRYSVLELFADDTIIKSLEAETGPISSHIWTLKESDSPD